VRDERIEAGQHEADAAGEDERANAESRHDRSGDEQVDGYNGS